MKRKSFSFKSYLIRDNDQNKFSTISEISSREQREIKNTSKELQHLNIKHPRKIDYRYDLLGQYIILRNLIFHLNINLVNEAKIFSKTH